MSQSPGYGRSYGENYGGVSPQDYELLEKVLEELANQAVQANQDEILLLLQEMLTDEQTCLTVLELAKNFL